MRPPKREDVFKWGPLLRVAKIHMGLTPQDFWKLTFSEFWEIHDALFGKQVKPMTVSEFKNLEGQWTNGDFRRTSNKPNRRDRVT